MARAVENGDRFRVCVEELSSQAGQDETLKYSVSQRKRVVDHGFQDKIILDSQRKDAFSMFQCLLRRHCQVVF